ncbi:hypothetical protein IF1G_06565 [Cordyceps javanica]|uniref:Uncharacterized protein n=1 Tax=Cordyceps javanica TaxID=43265 RepID=A0A545UYJ2_9HYPO|nr:hypothetical protein IF1G_06565 [Cordyceps javanica]
MSGFSFMHGVWSKRAGAISSWRSPMATAGPGRDEPNLGRSSRTLGPPCRDLPLHVRGDESAPAVVSRQRMGLLVNLAPPHETWAQLLIQVLCHSRTASAPRLVQDDSGPLPRLTIVIYHYRGVMMIASKPVLMDSPLVISIRFKMVVLEGLPYHASQLPRA